MAPGEVAEVASISDERLLYSLEALTCLAPGCARGSQAFKNTAGLATHMAKVHGIKIAKREKSDSTPPSIVLQFPGDKPSKLTDPVLAAVQERAEGLMKMAAALVLLAGQEADAVDMEKGAERWSYSVAELATHEKWLKALAAGGESSARTLAWIQFLVATGLIVLPMFLRHDTLPTPMAKAASMVMGMADTPQEAKATPVAA
jgi:hypothetical protein